MHLFKRKPWVMEVRDLWPDSIKAVGAMKESLGSVAATFPVLGIIWVICAILMFVVSRTSYQKDYDKINKA